MFHHIETKKITDVMIERYRLLAAFIRLRWNFWRISGLRVCKDCFMRNESCKLGINRIFI